MDKSLWEIMIYNIPKIQISIIFGS